jgi:hypothetical protein
VSESIHAISALAGLCFTAMAIGASFTFGAAMVGRWLKWAPINTTVNVYGPAAVARLDAVGAQQDTK